jgi:hypothetical protein
MGLESLANAFLMTVGFIIFLRPQIKLSESPADLDRPGLTRWPLPVRRISVT